MKNLKLKLRAMTWRFYASITSLCLVSVLGVGAGVEAFSSKTSPVNVVEHADTVVVNQAPEVAEVPVPEAILGALTSPDITSPYLCVNGDCTFHLVQTNQSATSTIFAFTNPFLSATTTAGDVVVTPTAELVNGIGQTGTTSTVEMIRIYVTTAATTTYSVMCASAATPYATSSLSQNILETGIAVTSTPVIESGFYNPPNSGVGVVLSAPWYSTASTTFPKIMLTPAQPYLICKVNPAANSAFVDNPNFVAKALVRVSRLRF